MKSNPIGNDAYFDRWANRLLDQSRSNRMIHFRKRGKQTLDLIDPSPDELFEAIVSRGRELSFKRPIDRDTAPRTYALLSLLSSLQHPVTVTVGHIGYRGEYSRIFETLTYMRRRNRLLQEEQGCHILYLVFGFVVWKDGKRGADGSPFVQSPLLLVPVNINQKRPSDPFTLKRRDDDIVVNPALAFMMEKKGIALPEFSEANDSLADYFEKMEVLAEEHGWQIVKETSIGLLSFQKISMYKDLEAHRDSLKKNRFVRALATGERFEPLPAIDPDSISFHESATVLSADSSQMQAILAARAGASFVMEGPPGTGKSQTIANIIADALLHGKKVLFVSSKNAALQVVYKRLEEAGLAPFSLAIHSHKANKLTILKDIEAALSIRTSDLSDKDKLTLSELDELREGLNRYHKALYTELSFYPITPYACQSALCELGGIPVLSLTTLPTSEEEFFKLLRLAAAYDREKASYLSAHETLPRELLGIRVTNSLEIESLRFAAYTLGKAFVSLGRIASEEGFSLDNVKMAELSSLAVLFSAAEILPKNFQKLLVGNKGSEALRLIEQYGTLAKEKEALEKKIEEKASESVFSFSLEAFHLKQRSLLILSRKDKLLSHLFPNRTLSTLTEDEVSALVKTLTECHKHLDELNRALREFARLSHTATVYSIDEAEKLVEYLPLIDEAATVSPAWYSRSIEKDLKTVTAARLLAETVTAIETKIVNEWLPSVFELDYRRLETAFSISHTGLFAMFASSSQREVKRLLRTYTKNGSLPSDESVRELFGDLSAYALAKRDFARHESALKSLTGTGTPDSTVLYRGAHTDFSALEKGLTLARDLQELGTPPDAVVRYFATPAAIRNRALAQKALNGMLTALVSLSVYRERDAALYDLLKDTAAGEVLLAQTLSLTSQYEALIKDFSTHALHPLTLEEREALIRELSRRRTVLDEMRTMEATLSTLTESRFTLTAIAPFSEPLLTLAAIERQAPDLYCRVIELFGAKQKQNSALGKALGMIANNTTEAIFRLGMAFPDKDLPEESIRSVKSLVTHILEASDTLDAFIPVSRAYTALLEAGLSEFALAFEQEYPDNRMEEALRKSIYAGILKKAERECEALMTFSREKQSALTSRFAALDERALAIARRMVKAAVASQIPHGDRNWRGKDELSLFEEERAKRRHMPLRKLFSKIPQLLLTLKPCFMMSPLSVSYFLERDAYRFDLVIFDEASQLFPEDAIGAIRRSRQIIVAGDTHQLPPTDFFAVKRGEEDEDDEREDSTKKPIETSILECAAEVMPCHMLRWHYRSFYESLIAFSNYHIYQNRLVTFPSPSEELADTGVEYRLVRDGVYIPKEGINPKEAEACVAALKEHILSHADKSLGIIAFSKTQQSEIERAVTAFRLENPEFEPFFSETKDEPFFIKNLENVQGDERDSIIFSIGYGKNAKGRFSLNLGPLTQEGGERRLNVAITRAKHNIKLIGSITLSDFDLSRTESAGVHLLYRYIDYALHKEEALGKEESVRFDLHDPFLESVAAFLTEEGYTVKTYYGRSDCRVDLAVYHPEHRAAIAGLLTDGAIYAATDSCADRDRLRAKILGRMGWRLYPLWSAEWAKNEAGERQKLLAFLADGKNRQSEIESTLVQDRVFDPVSATKGCDSPEESHDSIAAGSDFRKESVRPSIPYGFSYYREADWARADVSDRSDKNGVIAERILYLVKEEAPLHRELLYRRLATSFRAGKLTESVKATLDKAVDTLLSEGKLIESEENFFKLSESVPVTVRIPAPDTTPRPFDHIATEELAAAMLQIIRETFGVLPDDLFLETVRLFGYERMGARMRAFLERALYRLLMDEKVVRVDGKIKLS